MAQKLRKCPECEKLYTDEQIIYCLEDGVLLKTVQITEISEESSPTLPKFPIEEKTEVLPNKQDVSVATVEVQKSVETKVAVPLLEKPENQVSVKPNRFLPILLSIFLTATVVGGLMYLFLGMGSTDFARKDSQNETPNQKEVLVADNPKQRTPEPKQTETAKTKTDDKKVADQTTTADNKDIVLQPEIMPETIETVKPTPTPQPKLKVNFYGGTYYLTNRDDGRSSGQMTINIIKEDNSNIYFSVGGPNWSGQGRVSHSTSSGFYNWQFTNGAKGRTVFTVTKSGDLSGQVKGNNNPLNWRFLAQRGGGGGK